ncbi:LptF/LptG family permease [Flavobacteriaceae bacterium F08102]|nr:LptF/LptG family permease [Flavobacteriaceae bacterium F08102]
MRILDKYILKKYFTTFFFTLMILIPIIVAINLSEKIGRFLEHPDLGAAEIVVDYYVPFILYYGITFMPLALFISTILFTSQLAAKTEIVAIHSSGISFTRFLRPYLIGASIIALVTLVANHFLVPHANDKVEVFEENYVRKRPKTKNNVSNVNLQLSANDFIYVRNYNFPRNSGSDFSYEHFDGLELKYKIIANSIRFKPKDSTYTLSNYKKRWIRKWNDSIATGRVLDTTFNFFPNDLIYVDYLAKKMPSDELYEHIKISENRGVKSLNNYKVELYKRSSMPVAAIILTVIAVGLAARKRRGGIGINLAVGVSAMFIYLFFLKVAEVIGAGATANAMVMVWLPNVIFAGIAFYIYSNAKR